MPRNKGSVIHFFVFFFIHLSLMCFRISFDRKGVALALARLKRRLLSQEPLSTSGLPMQDASAASPRRLRAAQHAAWDAAEEKTSFRHVVHRTRPVAVQVGTSGFFSRILNRFPLQGRSLCFAYGSGVFRYLFRD